MRLNLADIYHAGWHVFSIAVCCMMFAGAVVYGLSWLFRIDQTLSTLTACGTAICGAAAIAAIAPQIRSNENAAAISAAAVSLLGTVFTVVYSLSYHVLGFSPAAYGAFCGATLHEVAHAAAAGSAGGKAAVEMAVIVKLTRVALLVGRIHARNAGAPQRKVKDGFCRFTPHPLVYLRISRNERHPYIRRHFSRAFRISCSSVLCFNWHGDGGSRFESPYIGVSS